MGFDNGSWMITIKLLTSLKKLPNPPCPETAMAETPPNPCLPLKL
jgi:hypothetical protein